MRAGRGGGEMSSTCCRAGRKTDTEHKKIRTQGGGSIEHFFADPIPGLCQGGLARRHPDCCTTYPQKLWITGAQTVPVATTVIMYGTPGRPVGCTGADNYM